MTDELAPTWTAGARRRVRRRRRLGRLERRHRRGTRRRLVLLIEQLPFLGGTSTAVLDTFYGFYTPGERARARSSAASATTSSRRCATLGPVIERPNTYGAGTGVTYHAEHLKVAWETLVTRAGARVLLHALLQDADVRDGRVEAVVVATKAGLRRIGATVVHRRLRRRRPVRTSPGSATSWPASSTRPRR